MSLCTAWTLVKHLPDERHARPLYCRSWRCEICQPRRRSQLMAKAASGLPERFLTLTVNPSTGESQYDLVNDAISKITEKPGPYGIAHGATDFAAVKDIMIESVSSPDWDGGQGKIVIKAQRWDAPAVATGAGGGAGGLQGLSAADKAQLSKLIVYANELASFITSNPDSPFTPLKKVELQAIQNEIRVLQQKGANTPTKSDPTKQYYQDGKGSNAQPGIPLGEIQPTGTV